MSYFVPERLDEDIVAAPIEGWRTFKVTYSWDLLPVAIQAERYTPELNKRGFQAACGKVLGQPRHRAPVENCSCGFYAVKERPFMNPEGTFPYGFPIWVGAKVELWGRIEVHERGYRGEFMRIKELLLPYCSEEYKREIEEHWNPVPVSLLPTPSPKEIEKAQRDLLMRSQKLLNQTRQWVSATTNTGNTGSAVLLSSETGTLPTAYDFQEVTQIPKMGTSSNAISRFERKLKP